MQLLVNDIDLPRYMAGDIYSNRLCVSANIDLLEGQTAKIQARFDGTIYSGISQSWFAGHLYQLHN